MKFIEYGAGLGRLGFVEFQEEDRFGLAHQPTSATQRGSLAALDVHLDQARQRSRCRCKFIQRDDLHLQQAGGGLIRCAGCRQLPHGHREMRLKPLPASDLPDCARHHLHMLG